MIPPMRRPVQRPRPGSASSGLAHWLAFILSVLGFAAVTAAANPEPLDPKQIAFLEAAARGRFAGRWIEAGSNELLTLRLKAEALHASVNSNHLVGGLVVSKRYDSTNATRLVAYENLDLSAALTGFHLTALAYWFSVDLKSQTLDRIRESLTGVENLMAVSGRTGFIPTFAASADDPAYKAAYAQAGGPDPARQGFGRLAFPGNGGQVWLGGTPRETYSALFLGLSSVHKRVREPRIRTRTSNIVEAIVHRLEEDHWRIRDGKGHEAFVTPLLKAAILRTAASVRPEAYLRHYEESFAAAFAFPSLTPHPYGNPAPSLFAVADLITLSRLETNEVRSLAIQNRMTQIWRQTGSEINPWVAAAYVNSFDHAPNDQLASAILQGMLQLYPAPPVWQVARFTPATNTPVVNANGSSWYQHAQLLHRRVGSPLAWMESGHAILPHAEGPIAHSGVDYLTVFWMARDAGVIPPETAPRVAKTYTRPRVALPQTNTTLRLPGTVTNRSPAANALPR